MHYPSAMNVQLNKQVKQYQSGQQAEDWDNTLKEQHLTKFVQTGLYENGVNNCPKQ